MTRPARCSWLPISAGYRTSEALTARMLFQLVGCAMRRPGRGSSFSWRLGRGQRYSPELHGAVEGAVDKAFGGDVDVVIVKNQIT
jgi:hypothetical protein